MVLVKGPYTSVLLAQKLKLLSKLLPFGHSARALNEASADNSNRPDKYFIVFSNGYFFLLSVSLSHYSL
jgi:hypothetical protein